MFEMFLSFSAKITHNLKKNKAQNRQKTKQAYKAKLTFTTLGFRDPVKITQGSTESRVNEFTVFAVGVTPAYKDTGGSLLYIFISQ